jgi:hypothetical protein
MSSQSLQRKVEKKSRERGVCDVRERESVEGDESVAVEMQTRTQIRRTIICLIDLLVRSWPVDDHSPIGKVVINNNNILIYTVKVRSVHTLRCFHCPAN